MKKYLPFFLLAFITTFVYGQPQKVIVKSTIDSPTEYRYWPLSGKQLPFYDLSTPATIKQGETAIINLSDCETIYKMIIGKHIFNIYATANSTDTIYVYPDSLSFSGKNVAYNNYLSEAKKSDKYCQDYSRTRNHPLAAVNSLAEFKNIVSSYKAEDNKLLKSNAFTATFMQQQLLFIDLKYKALFLKKMISLYRSPDLTQEWIDEFKNMDFHFADETARKSEWFCGLLKDYVGIRKFMIEQIDPKGVADTARVFFFKSYCNVLTGNNLEYATAHLLYDDTYQKDYSKDAPAVYKEFKALFPQSSYLPVLSPGIEKTIAIHNPSHNNDKIKIVHYETAPESFSDIIRPFLGKVIYIDIWATSCAPCLEALSEVNEHKKLIPNADKVVFLYLSVDRDRLHEKWDNLINYYSLEGYHYRANEKTAKIIYTTFGDDRGTLSIPRYILVDKEGRIAFSNAAPLSDTVKVTEQLETLLK